MNRVLNRVALITGAGTGIGKACALLYAMEGASIILVGRREALLQEVASEVADLGGEALPVKGDVTDQKSVDRVVKTSLDNFKRIHILINSAGIAQKIAPVHEIRDAEWEQVIDTNLTGAFRMIRSLLPHFVEMRGGAIVNVSSTAGLTGVVSSAAYSVSKSGVIALTRCVATEYGRLGIRCNCICPGTVATPMTEGFLSDAERLKRVKSGNLLARIGHPLEIAQGILYLGSEESSFTTGAVLVVDGGRTVGLAGSTYE